MTSSTQTAGSPAHRIDISSRQIPPRGGFNATLVRIELARLLRNKRTIIFTMAMPLAFYLLFGLGHSDLIGNGNYDAYSMINFALYGAVGASCAIGASVSVERAQGWSRQLRLTPLAGSAYIAVKVFAAMIASLLPVIALFIVGALTHASMPVSAWPAAFLTSWICGSLFAALGLFVGYLVPSENAMQILGPALSLLGFGGGLFFPYSLMGHTMQTIAQFTPLWGMSMIARWPLMGGPAQIGWFVSAIAWIGAFLLGAVLLFRKDTARV